MHSGRRQRRPFELARIDVNQFATKHRDPLAGFGRDVKQALYDRTDRRQRFARREGQQVILVSNHIDPLRSREVDAIGAQLAETGLAFTKAGAGSHVAVIYRQRFSLASGRFAMIDDGLGFRLVPWSPSAERQIDVEGRDPPMQP